MYLQTEKKEIIMTQIEAYEKYLQADRLLARSRQVSQWLVESLEHQNKRGKLKTIDQVNLKMGQDLLEILDIYLEQ